MADQDRNGYQYDDPRVLAWQEKEKEKASEKVHDESKKTRNEFEMRVIERNREGWRVVERRSDDAVIENGEKIPHGFHIFLTIISFGIWGAVYGLHLMFGGLKRRRIYHENGKVRERRIK